MACTCIGGFPLHHGFILLGLDRVVTPRARGFDSNRQGDLIEVASEHIQERTRGVPKLIRWTGMTVRCTLLKMKRKLFFFDSIFVQRGVQNRV